MSDSGSFDEKKFKEEIQDGALTLLLTDVARRPDRKHVNVYNEVPREFQYNVLYLKQENSDPALTSNKIFSYKNKKEELEKFNFLQMDNLEIASLYPQIRIYKIAKVKDKIIEVEIPFEDYTSKDTLNYIFAEKDSRGSGVGLKSLDWKSLARNEASLAQFSAKLQFHVQDVTELERIRNSSEGVSVTLMDLLYPTLKEATLEQNSKFDKNSLTIKAVVGWNSDNNNAAKREILERYGQQTFWLTLSNHDFSFNEDGSVNVTIDYFARSEFDSFDKNDSDILSSKFRKYKRAVEEVRAIFLKAIKKFETTSDETELSRARTEFANAINSYRDYSKKIKPNPLGTTINTVLGYAQAGGTLENLDELKKLYDTWKKEVKETAEEARTLFFKEIILNFSKSEMIYNMKLDSFQLENLKQIYVYGDSSFIDFEDVEQISKSIKILKNTTNSKQNSANQTPNNDEIVETVSEVDPGDSIEKLSTDLFSSILSSLKKNSIFPEEEEEEIEVVPYLYLYDIINYFYNTSSINYKPKIVLGNISCKDLNFKSSDSGELKKKKLTKNDETESTVKVVPLQTKVINIGDIPITLKSFMNWLSNDIISKDLPNLSFGQFLDKIFKNLVYKNFNTRFIKFFPSYDFKINTKQATVDLDFTEEKDNENDPNHVYPEKTFYNIKESMAKTASKNNKGRKDYLFIFPESEKPKGRKANYEDDFYNNNIHHFYVGEEKGLLRSVKFSREDMPRLETVNVGKANEAGNLGFIRHPYRAQIQLFGNTIFDTGNIIYLSPTYPGTGIRNSAFHKIGLSGYYVVHAVDSYIEMGEYRTELNCYWQSYAESKSNNQPPTEGEQAQPTVIQVE